MRRIVLAIATLFALTSLSAQQLLMEGGKKTAGATSGQVLKWNGTTWAPAADDAGAGVDETWGKGSYSSPTFSGKTITDAVFRRGAVSIGTGDSTSALVVREKNINEDLTGAITVQGRTNGDSVNIFMRLKSSDTDATQLIIGATNSGVISPAGRNTSWFYGTNIYPGGTRIDTSRSAMSMVFKENFLNALPLFGNTESAEMHWIFTPKWNPLNKQSRIISAALDHKGRVGNLGIQSDVFYIERFGRSFDFRPWDTPTWLQADFYNGTWDFGDTISVRMPHNNVGGYWQRRNGGDNAYIRMLMVDNLDRILLGGSGPASRVAAYNHLEVTDGGLISNGNGEISVGDDTYPTRLTVKSNDGAGFTLRRVGNTNAATHGLFGSQYYFTNPALGNIPYIWDITAPDYTIYARSTGKVGIGEPNPTGWLHVNTSLGATAATFATTNTTGTNSFFRTGTTPAGAISANPGDMALSGAGELYGKYSGVGTTSGWGKYLNLIDPNSASSGNVLKWNGSAWAPATDETGSVSQPVNQVVYGTGSGITSDTSLKYTSRTLQFSDVAGTTVPKILINYKDATDALTAFEMRPYSQTNFPYPTKFGIYASNFPLANGGAEPGNHVYRMGYNRGRPATRFSALEIAFESLYKQVMLNNQLTYNYEWHVEQIDTLGAVHRPITIRGAHNGTVGDVGFQSDGFYLAKYNDGTPFVHYNRFNKLWYNDDTLTYYFNKRQVGIPFMSFRSADNSRLYKMFEADASNRLVINPEANDIYTFAQNFTFNTASGITTNDGNGITIGTASKPSLLQVIGTSTNLLNLTRGANTWSTFVNNDNVVWSRPDGNGYLQVYNGDQSILRMANNKTAIGYGSLQSRFSINQLTNTAEGGIGLYNTTGQASYIQTNASGALSIDLPGNADRVVVTTTGTGFNGVPTPLATVDMFGDINIHSSAGASLFLGDEAFQNPSFYNRAPGLKAIYNATQGVASDLGLYAYNGNRLLVATASENGNFAIGNTAPSEKLHVTGNIRVTGAIKDGNNEAGTSGQFLKSTGSSTDWVNVAPSDLSQAAATSGQVLKWNGTIWAPATDDGVAYTVGTFSTTGNANAISVSGSTLTAHAATATTPGSVSLADGQVLGDGGKIIQNNLNGETTALTLRNNAAAGADTGPGLVFQAGSGNANMFQIQADMTSGAATTGAQTYVLNRNSSNGMSTHVTFQPSRTTQINGFFGEEIRGVATTLDVSANFGNRYPHYCFTAAAASLTLPLATNVVDGTRIQITSLLSSGTACTVNTAAAYAEFMFDYDLDAVTGGNQFFGANLSVASGQSFVLSKVSITGTGYWKVVSASAGASLQALSNSSTATTHQVSLTSNGGSLQLSEGTNISLTTTGTVADGIVTITGAELRAESFTATASQTSFSTSAPAYSAPSGNRMPFTVERNGVPLIYVASAPNFKQFTYSGSTITTSACDVNDVVVIKYLTN